MPGVFVLFYITCIAIFIRMEMAEARAKRILLWGLWLSLGLSSFQGALFLLTRFLSAGQIGTVFRVWSLLGTLVGLVAAGCVMRAVYLLAQAAPPPEDAG